MVPRGEFKQVQVQVQVQRRRAGSERDGRCAHNLRRHERRRKMEPQTKREGYIHTPTRWRQDLQLAIPSNATVRSGGDWRWVLKRHKHRRKAALWRKMVFEESNSSLPLHLIVQQILVRLPLRKIQGHLSCVCKCWNALLSWGGSVAAMDFPQHHLAEEYWFVMRSLEDAGLFALCSSHDEGSLSMLPLCSDKLVRCCRHIPRKCEESSWALHIISAGGLMCALSRSSYDDNRFDIVVFNCLTGRVKVLPSPLRPEKFFCDGFPHAVSMAMDGSDPCRFYVMLEERSFCFTPLDRNYFEVFDSKRGRWREGAKTCVESESGLLSADFFFFEEQRPDMIGGYHAAQNAWSILSVPWPFSKCFGHPHRYGGRLFRACLASHVRQAWPHIPEFVVLELKLSESASTWVEVSRTPGHLKAQLVPLQTTFSTIQAEGSLFYTRMWSREGFRSPLVYDISKDSWYLQALPLGEFDFEFLFVHRPRLSMFLA